MGAQGLKWVVVKVLSKTGGSVRQWAGVKGGWCACVQYRMYIHDQRYDAFALSPTEVHSFIQICHALCWKIKVAKLLNLIIISSHFTVLICGYILRIIQKYVILAYLTNSELSYLLFKLKKLTFHWIPSLKKRLTTKINKYWRTDF